MTTTPQAMMSPFSGLAGQVGCATHPALGPLLARVRHEAMTIPDEWMFEYGPWQSGGWGTLSLLNGSGVSRDVTIGDTQARPTELLERMPATRLLLKKLGLDCWWVRLARLAPGSYLWEHRDYTEHGLAGVERHRVHIPLVTSGAAFLVVAGCAVHLAHGRLWRLTPTHVHGACNRAGPDRIHLILDCRTDDILTELRRCEQFPMEWVRLLPVATPKVLEAAAAIAWSLAGLGFTEAAERSLLKLCFSHALPSPGHGYDMLADLHTRRGDAETAARWRAHKRLMLGNVQAGERP